MKFVGADQKAAYEADGRLLLEGAIAPAIVNDLCAMMHGSIDRSRSMTASSPDILLGPGHAPQTPNAASDTSDRRLQSGIR
jgi:hypothetical protein